MDNVPEVAQNELGVKLGDIFELGEHRLMCGDSTDLETVEKLMNGEKADMAVTDPPYGINAVVGEKTAAGSIKEGNKAKAGQYNPIIGDSSTDIARAAYQLLKEFSCKQIIFGGNYFTDFLPVNGHWLVWNKIGYEKTHTFSDAELAWTSVEQTSVKMFTQVWDGMWREGNRKDELAIRVHPTQKPVGLIEKIVSDYTELNQSVLDLFGGSGSTLIASEKANRKCFMMELDPHYCSVIIKRWEEYTGKKHKKLS